MKTVLLSSVLAFSLSGCLMPSGINPTLGCSPITGCTSKDYYIPGRGVWAPKQSSFTKAKIGAVGGAVTGAYLGRGDPFMSAAGAVVGVDDAGVAVVVVAIAGYVVVVVVVVGWRVLLLLCCCFIC